MPTSAEDNGRKDPKAEMANDKLHREVCQQLCSVNSGAGFDTCVLAGGAVGEVSGQFGTWGLAGRHGAIGMKLMDYRQPDSSVKSVCPNPDTQTTPQVTTGTK